ncbi:hypothetical protein Vadar_003354 [Vaccinium darrowii]|uniref:Uncharacterized protein n=1 Tax=Vaccinium darrowii TaxID=229202 RepID=A0ACB7ZH59_9ERIC|nr:hypothetical protein Vadar_003354 [Vaccinium darrowii]
MKAWDYFFDVDMLGLSLRESNDVNEKNDDRFNEFEMKTPEKVMSTRGFETEEEEMVTPVRNGKVQFMHSNTAPLDIRRGSASSSKVVGGSSVNLLKILGDIDDHFLKASEAAQEVSKMLEATRLHYHLNFADNRGN